MWLHHLRQFALEEASNLYLIPNTSPHHWPQHVYQGPSADAADNCRCNTVFYSLIAACSACQGRDFVP